MRCSPLFWVPRPPLRLLTQMLSALLGASPAPATQSPGASRERPSGDPQVAGRVRAQDGIAELKRLIIERTEGNPFFMEEMVLVLFDEGALVQGDPHPGPLPKEAVDIGAISHG
jgi:hypothetical protein